MRCFEVKGTENFKKELSTTFENEVLIIPNHFLLQGQENDIILVSLVRSNNENKIGFLSQKNRICVAISRARCGLYLFGNQAQLEYKSSVWKVCWVILNLATDSWVVCDLRSLLWTSDKPIRLLVPLPSSRAGNLFITLHTPPKNVIIKAAWCNALCFCFVFSLCGGFVEGSSW